MVVYSVLLLSLNVNLWLSATLRHDQPQHATVSLRTSHCLRFLSDLSSQSDSAASAPESEVLEPLFLEFSIQEVVTNTSWIPVVEPWASQYVSAVREGRYGDAVWARYHIAGDVHDGIVGGTTNMTVLQSIEEDALEYKTNDPEGYTNAQAFYAQTSELDGHKDVIEVILHPGSEDIPGSEL